MSLYDSPDWDASTEERYERHLEMIAGLEDEAEETTNLRYCSHCQVTLFPREKGPLCEECQKEVGDARIQEVSGEGP